MARPRKSDLETPAQRKEHALKMLSDDNRKWLAGWELQGWVVTIDEQREWTAEKRFDGESDPVVIGNAFPDSSLNEVEKRNGEESQKRRNRRRQMRQMPSGRGCRHIAQ